VRVRLLAIVLLVAPAAAWASGLSAPEVGTSRSSPVSEDPAAVYWNPALLVGQGSALLGTASAILLGVHYTRERLSPYQHADGLAYDTPVPGEALDPGRAGEVEPVSALQVIPGGALYGALPLGEDLALGGGLYFPFAAMLSFPEDGAQRWALQQVQLVVGELGAGLGWRATPTLRLGVGAALVGGLLELRREADLAGTELLAGTFSNPPINQDNAFGPRAPSEVRELDALSRPATLGPAFTWSWAARLGAAFEPDDDWLVGVSYVHRGPTVFVGGFELDLDDPLFTHDLEPQGLKYPRAARGRVEVDFPLPDSVHAGIAWRSTPRLELAATLAWFSWSVVEALDVRLESNDLVQPELGLGPRASMRIPRAWSDTLQADVRALYRLRPAWELGGLLGYHSPASPDTTLDVASPDGHRVVAALLAGWQPGGPLDWQGSLQLQWVPERLNQASDMDLGNGRYGLVLVTATVGARWRPGAAPPAP